MGKPLKMIRRCVHCGNTTPQKVVYEYMYDSDHIEHNDELVAVCRGQHFAVTCETCDQLSLYTNESCDIDDPNYLPQRVLYKAKLIWPNVIKLDPTAIPNTILEIYEEASKVKSLSANSFVVLIRRALEAICIEQGVNNKKSLHASLKELTEPGKLPPLISEVTNIIKMIGNAGAHLSRPPVLQTHVSAIDDFFRVVLEYLYIAPSKLKKFKEEAAKFNLQETQSA